MNANTEIVENYNLTGNKLEIFTYPAPILKKVAKPVTEFNEELKKLCTDMLFTMYHAPGIGLAAPQIGESLRIFVMDIDFKREEVTRADGTKDFELSEFNLTLVPSVKLISASPPRSADTVIWVAKS